MHWFFFKRDDVLLQDCGGGQFITSDKGRV